MVRRCCAAGCTASDKSILAHRFPKTISVAAKWQKALDLQRYSLNKLQNKFVVCTKHFLGSAYRNEESNCLNSTAIPNLKENLCNQRAHEKHSSKRAISKTKSIDLESENSFKRLHSNPKRVKQETVKEVISTVVFETSDEPETFELYEYTEESVTENENESNVVDNQLNLALTYESREEPEPPKQIFKCNQESQTDDSLRNEPPVIEDSMAREQESKDEKLISILYPEYQGIKKIHLIEIVNEKNRKIESLEDKVKKLELAMRNLL